MLIHVGGDEHKSRVQNRALPRVVTIEPGALFKDSSG